jgi:hypothetical protein
LILSRLDLVLEHDHVVRNATVFDDRLGTRVEESVPHSTDPESQSLIEPDRPYARVGRPNNQATRAPPARHIDNPGDGGHAEPRPRFFRSTAMFLISRLSSLRKLTGWNEPIQYRRMLGLFAFFLLITLCVTPRRFTYVLSRVISDDARVGIVFFTSISGCRFLDFPNREVQAERTSWQHLSFRYVALLLAAF